MADNKPTLHYLENSQAQQTLWLLEELGIEYDLVLHERVQSRAPPELKETHPLGKAPQLVTATGRVITERSAIALYLIETFDTSKTFQISSDGGENDAVREEQLLSLGGSSLNPLLVVKLVFWFVLRQSPFYVRWLVTLVKSGIDKAYLDPEIALFMGYLDGALQGREWFMNTKEPTRVDFCLQWYADFAHEMKLFDIEKYENLKAWRERCVARPAWKRALEKGNGYGSF